MPEVRILTRFDPPERQRLDQQGVHGDVWALGVVIFECLQCLAHGCQEEQDHLVLRDLSQEARFALLRESVPDTLYRELLTKLLADERPSARDLLSQDASLLFYRYLLFFEPSMDLGALLKRPEIVPALCSGLALANKDNACLSLLSLLSAPPSFEPHLLEELYHSSRYTNLLELLVLSFRDFARVESHRDLYEQAFRLLEKLLCRHPDAKPRCLPGGMVTLLMLMGTDRVFYGFK